MALIGSKVCRFYETPAGRVRGCQDVDIELREGEFVVVYGPSGAGKSSLLHSLSGIARPSSGRVKIGKTEFSDLDDAARVRFTSRHIGLVFESIGLIPMLSAIENVEVPLRIRRLPRDERVARASAALEMVGVSAQAFQRPDELSGGQRQRVSLARAIVTQPSLLFADEPTAQLDSSTSRGVLSMISEVVRSSGMTAVIATHDPNLMDFADKVIVIRDGRVSA